MPELPEVETVANDLSASKIIGRKLLQAQVNWEATIATPEANDFCQEIQGKEIKKISRRAKFLVIKLSKGWTLLVHLRMTGRFFLDSERNLNKHEHVDLLLDDGRHLYFHDTRKFGRFYLTKNPEKILSKLGPEPLSKAFDLKAFKKQICQKNRALKSLLLDQSFIAGLGNIYVDEVLWQAKLHPEGCPSKLSSREIKRLFLAIKEVLKRGIKNSGTTLGKGKSNFYSINGEKGQNQNHLKVFRKLDKPCPRCKTSIIRLVVCQRSTFICPKCQSLDKKKYLSIKVKLASSSKRFGLASKNKARFNIIRSQA